MSVNLLSFQFQRRSRLQRLIRQWSAGWILVLAALALWFWRPAQEFARQRGELRDLQTQVQPVMRQQDQVQALERSIKRTRAEEARLVALLPQDRSLAILGILANAARDAGEIQLQRVGMTLGQEQFAAAGTNAAAARSGAAANGAAQATAPALAAALQSLHLQGVAGDDQAVMKFVANLERAAVFAGVELKSTTEFQLPRKIGRQFQIECRFGD